MDINMLMLLVILFGGVFYLMRGLKAKRTDDCKQTGNLYLTISTCAFCFIIIAILVHLFKPTHSLGRIVLVIQGFVCGVWFGVLLTMRILGLKYPKETNVKINTDHKKPC